jgi:elongation factor G
LGLSLKLATEDPIFRVRTDEETGQTIISGMGELHLKLSSIDCCGNSMSGQMSESLKWRIKRQSARRLRQQGRFIRQTGGRGQYGDVWIKLEPLAPGSGFEFVDAVKGGSIPREYIPAVEKGVKEATENGALAGYPIVDVKVTLFDGSYHDVDSSEIAFKIAGSMAFKEAARKAHPVLLEPIMSVEVVVPEDFMGDVIGDLSARRGKVLGMDTRPAAQAIDARRPSGGNVWLRPISDP